MFADGHYEIDSSRRDYESLSKHLENKTVLFAMDISTAVAYPISLINGVSFRICQTIWLQKVEL